MLRLAVVVPATDSPPTLDRCVAAVLAADAPPDELHVVDEPHATGPAVARNAGAARAQADILVFVDSDVVVARDAFVRIREHFSRDPSLVAVFGAYDDAVATTRLTARFRNLLHHYVHARGAGIASTFWAGIGAVRREAFERVGGFDAERYAGPSIEDVELGLRLADTGALIRLDPAIRGTHLKDWTLGQMLRTDFSSRGVPWVHLLLERREAPATLNLGWRERGSALAAVSSVAFFARGRPFGVAACALALVALNQPFYRLLARRLGTLEAAACVAVHAAHHLAGAAAVPAGVASYAAGRGRPQRAVTSRK